MKSEEKNEVLMKGDAGVNYRVKVEVNTFFTVSSNIYINKLKDSTF